MIPYLDSTVHMSPDGVYRYCLHRRWEVGPCVLWVMLNPSTASAALDDPTIRKCCGFARAWGYGAIEVVNLFAFRTKDPKILRAHGGDRVGPENETVIAHALRVTYYTVVAWGQLKPQEVKTGRDVRARLFRERPVHCLGINRDGSPRHPLYAPYATQPILYP
jgi:hypothetical protein